MLDNRLAEEMPSVGDEPLSIRLTFQPKGLGHAGNDFYLTPRANMCVVCGTGKKLTRHHVVPYQYTHCYPEELKRGCSHDILPLCESCHVHAERENNFLRDELAEKYEAPVNGVGLEVDLVLYRAQRAYNTLDKYLHLIPKSRKEDLLDRMWKYFGRKFEDVSQDEVDEMMKLPSTVKTEGYKTHGQMVIEKIEDLEAFSSMWRGYFLSTMEPAYLPRGWSVDHKVEHSPIKEADVDFYRYIPVKDLQLGHLLSAQEQIPKDRDWVVMSIENKGVLWDERIHRCHDISSLRDKLRDTKHFNSRDRIRFVLDKDKEGAK